MDDRGGRRGEALGSVGSGQQSVTPVESPQVRKGGLGEGAWLTLRETLLRIRVSETGRFRECDSAFKQDRDFSNGRALRRLIRTIIG